jgi:hypothetical protein
LYFRLKIDRKLNFLSFKTDFAKEMPDRRGSIRMATEHNKFAFGCAPKGVSPEILRFALWVETVFTWSTKDRKTLRFKRGK